MNSPLPVPGDRLGHYLLEREVGRGAMGVVYEATHQFSGRRVALKLLVFPPLLPEGEREALILRFAREARALATVRHPHVVAVFEVGAVDGQPFMAMEYLEGLNAREWLLRYGPMPPEAAAALGEQLCAALEAVHTAGMVHRDIKPDNVVLEADGKARLTDFGIARMEVEASLTRTGGLVGSPAYMAPEQILGSTVDARSDLFSTGVMLYQMLTGELPFQGASLMEVAHRVAYEPPRPPAGLPPGLATILLRALEKDPDRRYATAAELQAALGAWRTGDARIEAPDVSPTVTIAGGRQPFGANPFADRRQPGTHGGSDAASPSGAACSRHHLPPVAACAECDTPLCGRCIRHRHGRAWCPEHAHPRPRPAWVTRLEVLAVGLLFALLLWSLYPLRW